VKPEFRTLQGHTKVRPLWPYMYRAALEAALVALNVSPQLCHGLVRSASASLVASLAIPAAHCLLARIPRRVPTPQPQSPRTGTRRLFLFGLC
jgi:hypothetical protein